MLLLIVFEELEEVLLKSASDVRSCFTAKQEEEVGMGLYEEDATAESLLSDDGLLLCWLTSLDLLLMTVDDDVVRLETSLPVKTGDSVEEGIGEETMEVVVLL